MLSPGVPPGRPPSLRAALGGRPLTITATPHLVGQAMSNRFSCFTAVACVACVIVFAPQAFAQSKPLYTVTKTVALGAPDHWDFVVFDPASHKVFVAHGDRVTVVDGRIGTILGNVEGLPGGTHGIA